MYQKSCHMLYCSWDMMHDRCDCCFSFWAIFCPLIPPPNSLKKTANISSFHTSVPKIMITYTSIQKIMIIYYTVPKIWHVMDVIVIFHFGLSFALPVPKMKIFKKWKKMTWYIIILRKCTKNHDHMLYCSYDMAHDGCNCYFSFWAIFCPFTLLTAKKKMKIQKHEKNCPKNKNSKTWKNSWRYYHFTQLYQKSWSYATMFLRYGVWQM